MKKTIFLLFLIATHCYSFCQTTQEVVSLYSKQQYYLNGATMAALNGKSRIYLEVNLPQNTVEWYYVLTTSPNTVEQPNIELAAQLTKLIDHTGLTAIAVSALMAPTGSGNVDVYLINDASNVNKFINKDDLWGSGFNYVSSDSRQNFIQGAVQIKDAISGTVYIGIRNPSMKQGVYVTIEVAAIVKKEDLNVWSKEQKDTVYNSFYSALLNNGISENNAKELSTCIIENLTSQKTPAELDGMSKNEVNDLILTISKKCKENMQGGPKTQEQEKAVTYGNLGWNAYQNGEIDRCIELSKKAIGIDSTLGWVKTNLGLCCLIKGDESAATDYYVDAISAIKNDKLSVKKYFEAAIQDINDALKKYPDLKGYKDIEDLLQTELRNY